MSDRVKLAFCWIVSIGWLINLVAGMIPSLQYDPSLIVNAPMLLVLGAVFNSRGKKAKSNDPD